MPSIHSFLVYKKSDPPLVTPTTHSSFYLTPLPQHQTEYGLRSSYLLRTGEYLENAPNALPFTLAHVRLWVNGQQIDPLSAPIESLRAATFMALTFTEQKNAVCGEAVGHGKSMPALSMQLSVMLSTYVLTRHLPLQPCVLWDPPSNH
jgi:hypothetical protein